MNRRHTVTLVGLLIVFLQVISSSAYAAEPSQPASPAGITLSPTLIDIDLSKEGTKPEFQLTVRNNLPIAQTFDTSSLDINGLNDDNSVAFIEPGQPAPRGIAANLRYTPTNLSLQPNESKTITVTIVDTDKLSPGGHYGAAVIGNQTEVNREDNQVAIRQAVSSLIFITTRTGGVRTVTANAVALPGFGWRLPSSVDVVIENTGNTQTAPVGYGRISRGDAVAGQGILNPARNLILPDQNRIFRINLNQNTGWRLAGTYRFELHYQATPTSSEQVVNRTFLYVNPWFVLAIGAVWAIITITIILTRKIIQKRRQK